jgi:hypothetical protein
MSNNEVEDREEGQDGPGGNEGEDNGISPSQITAWLGMQMQSSYGMWHSNSLGSIPWIIAQLSCCF